MCDSFIWGLVSQTSYQLGSFAIALKSSDVLWHYFVDVQPIDNSSVSQYWYVCVYFIQLCFYSITV